MAAYSPPSGGRTGKLRFDFNENTVGCSPRVLEALTRNVSADALSMYPEYSAAIADLAVFFNVGADEFTLTNGTDEAIQLLINTFIDPGADVLVLKPSYAMYRFYADVAGASVREIGYHPPDFGFPLEDLIAAI